MNRHRLQDILDTVYEWAQLGLAGALLLLLAWGILAVLF